MARSLVLHEDASRHAMEMNIKDLTEAALSGGKEENESGLSRTHKFCAMGALSRDDARLAREESINRPVAEIVLMWKEAIVYAKRGLELLMDRYLNHVDAVRTVRKPVPEAIEEAQRTSPLFVKGDPLQGFYDGFAETNFLETIW